MDSNSAANRRRTGSSDIIPSEEEVSGFKWKGDSLQEYWEYTLNAVTWPDNDDKGQGMVIIVDNGGDMTLLIHKGKKAEDLFLKDGTLHVDDGGDITLFIHEGKKEEDLFLKDGTLPVPTLILAVIVGDGFVDNEDI